MGSSSHVGPDAGGSVSTLAGRTARSAGSAVPWLVASGAAQSALANLVADVDSGRLVPGHPMSVGELLDRWLDDVGPHRSAYTLREYRRMADKNIKPAIGAVRLDRLTARQLDAFYKRLGESGLSDASVRRHHSLLHAALGRAVKWGLVSSNPSDRATSPTPVRSTATAPSSLDVQKVLAAAEAHNPSLAAGIALGAVTGARRGELAALRWSDVDWKRRTLRVARSLTVIGSGVTEGPRRPISVETWPSVRCWAPSWPLGKSSRKRTPPTSALGWWTTPSC